MVTVSVMVRVLDTQQMNKAQERVREREREKENKKEREN
jgi:hypothetical protein